MTKLKNVLRENDVTARIIVMINGSNYCFQTRHSCPLRVVTTSLTGVTDNEKHKSCMIFHVVEEYWISLKTVFGAGMSV